MNRTGNVVVNTSTIYDEEAFNIIKDVFKSGLCVSPYINLKEGNSKEEIQIKTICGTTIDGILLNGMPCDRVTKKIKKNENYVETETTKMIHEIYWVKQGGSNAIYEKLVEAFIQGMISKEGYIYSRSGNVNKIYKKNPSE